MPKTVSPIEQHYSHAALMDRILSALRNTGHDLDSLSYSDLWPLDQFHIRGRDATVELAQLAGIHRDMRVLDVGCGIGGPARLLAGEFGCHVTGLDLTEQFCYAGAQLTEMVGLSDRLEFRCADALDMPFEAESFDAAWTQHASMNIAGKSRLYSEIHRVLKTNGRLALYDVAAGIPGPIHFPVPWARDPSISFLASPGEMRRDLENAGFRVLLWKDDTPEARVWFREMAERQAAEGDRPRLGLYLVQGPEWPVMIANVARNLLEQRLAIVQAVLEK